MALTIKQLAAGTSVGASTEMYSGPTGKSAIVKNMRFVDTHASQTATLNVFLRIGSTDV